MKFLSSHGEMKRRRWRRSLITTTMPRNVAAKRNPTTHALHDGRLTLFNLLGDSNMNACNLAKKYAPLVGRVLLANIFIVAGYKKIPGFAGTLGYMASKMPAVDPMLLKIMLVVTILVELGGGILILLGWQARWAAAAVLLWLVPVTLIFHAYWGLPAQEMQAQFIHFQKNLAIVGGLLYITAFGSGVLSLGKDEC
jgi:putative oxidoreductase